MTATDKVPATETVTVRSARTGRRSATPPLIRHPIVLVVGSALLAVALLAGAREYVVDVALVDGSSMTPTLATHQMVVIDKLDPPSVGDVVVFRPPDDWSSGPRILVKRVIAVGGSQIACCDSSNLIVVDGTPVDEDYLLTGTDGLPTFDRHVPEGMAWVLGDNRGPSNDSSSHLNASDGGAVPMDRIIGVVREWP